MSNSLPKIEELRDVFHNTQGILPSIDGFAAFTCDELGVGAFNFCDDLDEWKEFYPALIFIESLHFSYEIYGDDLISLEKIFVTLEKCSWDKSDFYFLIVEKNNLLLGNDILFAGSIKDLFIEDDGFVSELIEEFGENPNENVSEYLEFLQAYFRG